MKRRRLKVVEAPNKPARSSSSSDKEAAQAQGLAEAEVAAAEAKKEDGEKARGIGEGVVGGRGAALEVDEERMEVWEEWPWWWRWTREVADEEDVSFRSVWSPFWDGDFVGDEAYNSLFGDVVWDDDLWNLKDLEKPKA